MSALSNLTASVNSMTTRFPEFANIDPTLIQLALDEALLFMGDWQQPGLVPAQLYLAAHILALNSYAADNGGMDIQSESIGRITLHYRITKTDIDTDLQNTVYGRRYRQYKEMGIKKFQTFGCRSRLFGYNDPWGN
jgi:hypothetical protein